MTRTALHLEPTARAGTSFVGARLGALIASHPVLDAYAGYVPPILGLLLVRCDLTAWQAAALLSLGSLISGLCQPLFAWLTDRIDSRAFGTAGVAVAAAALSCIGLARDFPSLVALFALGMLGVGAFHPVAAASVGELAGRRRSAGVTWFFVAGMVGATAGPIISTRITAIEPDGFELLRWTMIPGLVVAVTLHLAIGRVPHRAHEHHRLAAAGREGRENWSTVAMLFAGNAMRYSVYMALLYLYVQSSRALIASTADPASDPASLTRAAAIYCGELNALTMFGMGLGGLLAGILVRPGGERGPVVLIPLALAPAVAALPLVGRGGSYALAVGAGVGFAAVIPLTISVAQRLLPHRTSFASSLMMGGAWAIAAVGPPGAEWCRNRFGLGTAFAAVAVVLAASGVVGLMVSPRVIARVAAREVAGSAGPDAAADADTIRTP